MIKKVIVFIVIIIVIVILYFCFHKDKNVLDGDGMIYEKVNDIFIVINGNEYHLSLEDNDSVYELVHKLDEGEVRLNLRDYGGFEKVGDLGFSLSSYDKRIKTEYGDVVLYQGNQIVLFYGSNTWEYTKIGHILNIHEDELRSILGDGDATVILRKQ